MDWVIMKPNDSILEHPFLVNIELAVGDRIKEVSLTRVHPDFEVKIRPAVWGEGLVLFKKVPDAVALGPSVTA